MSEEAKRRLLDTLVADIDDLDDGYAHPLSEILEGVPKKEWGDVLFYFNKEGDYYGGTIVNGRFYTQREETDEEYEKRLKLLRAEEEAQRVRAEKQKAREAENERKLYERLKAKFES